MDISAVVVSPSDPRSGTAGEIFTLECSADIMTQSDSPSPTFEWFFDSNNTSLPSGVMVSDVTKCDNTYTSTLQFSPLQESHAGMITCQLGGNARLAVNANITVNGITPLPFVSCHSPSSLLQLLLSLSKSLPMEL